ncbi:hypothetical protein [Lacticaseibacillus saniviri]
MKWRYLTVLMALLSGFTLLTYTSQTVKAADTPGYGWMTTLPDGTRYPNPPELSPGVAGYVPFSSTFSLIDTKNNSTIALTSPTNASQQVGLIITKGTQSQNGAVWSNNPIFNLNKQHQSISMDLLIQSTGTSVGDGTAFALAGTRPTTLGTNGAQLGVWGKEYVPKGSSASAALVNQLPNSAVIVMDTKLNSTTLDSTIKNATQYVGFGYPSMVNTYTTTGLSTSSSWPVALHFNSDINSKPTQFKNPTDDSLSLYYRPYDATTLVASTWHVFEVNWDRSGNGGTLTYKLADANGANAVTRKITWTDAQIDTIFGETAQKKVFVGFTGTTATYYEANVLAFRTIPGIVNANGSETLTTDDGTAVTKDTLLHTGNRLQYNFNVSYDNDSQENWATAANGTLSLTFTKNKYFQLKDSTIKLYHADGSPLLDSSGKQATATVSPAKASSDTNAADDPTKVVVSGIPGFIKGTPTTGSQAIKFNIGATVTKFDATDIKPNATLAVSDNTGTVAGDNAQVHLENTTNTSDPFMIQYQLQNIAVPAIANVPSLLYMNLYQMMANNGSLAAGSPKVSELIDGYYTDSKLPTLSSTNDVNNVLMNPNLKQLVGYLSPPGPTYDPNNPADPNDPEKPNPDNPTPQQLNITGNNVTSKWTLSLTVPPLKNGGQALPVAANLAFANSFKDGVVSYLQEKNTNGQLTPIVVHTSPTDTVTKTLLTSDNLPSDNESTDNGFAMSGSVFSILYFDSAMPTIKAGSYTSQVTWTLTTAP